MKQYEKFDLKAVAKRGENYITTMVDEAYDYLPYWYIEINEKPAYARHVRVDDAELVASWYEAISCTIKILGEEASEKAHIVKEAFKRHLLKSWGEHGLRFHEPYSWSNIKHTSFHEMGWVLSGLNRLLEDEPDNAEAEKRASELVRGLRSLVHERKIRTFWNGDYHFGEDIFEFPSDLYIAGEGFVPERVTGRGEECIRNGVLIQPLAVRAEKFGDEVALELACGLANHLLEMARYFNYKGEYYGHVHSTVWTAMGLIRLGRYTKNEYYIKKGYQIYNYTKSLSSEYGWVPEYAQWHPMSEEHCETCCIRDMIECALELIECGYDEWDVVNKYTRNHLTEQQFTYGGFVSVDNSKEDKNEKTWKDIDKRMIGGWSGGGEANSLSLTKFRAIAGCCVGTAPQALFNVYKNIAVVSDDAITVNLPIDKEDENVCITTNYPNEGYMSIVVKKNMDLYIRQHDFMGDKLELRVDGVNVPVVYRNGLIYISNVASGTKVELLHEIQTEIRKEVIQEKEFEVSWRGSDVVKIEPEGEHLRLYQREIGAEKYYPLPDDAKLAKTKNMGPTQQKR